MEKEEGEAAAQRLLRLDFIEVYLTTVNAHMLKLFSVFHQAAV